MDSLLYAPKPSEEEVARKTLRQKVYESLRASIISGEILPGQNLTLRRLSSQYQVSIVPVREALFQLAAEGVIVQRNNRDYRVGTLTPAEFDEVYRMRELLELYVAQESIRSQPAEAEERLVSIVECMQASVRTAPAYVRCNQVFHFTLYSFADLPMTMRIIESLWTRIGPYLSIHSEMIEDRGPTVAHHVSILDAYLARDESAFVDRLRRDLRHAREMLTPLVERLNVDSDSNLRDLIVATALGRQQQPG